MTAGQLALDTTLDPAAPLKPGDWTPTGWGAQHRVRRSDERYTELVCHLAYLIDDPGIGRKAGDSARCETARIDRTASEDYRCIRCASLTNLGPMARGPLGEIRRGPDGQVAVCHDAGGFDRRWKLIGAETEPMAYGWRGDWHVATWVVVGNVLASA